MSGAVAPELTDNRGSRQVQVAESIEQLVTDKLVRVAQAAIVENAVAAYHDRVFQRAAEGEPRGAQSQHVVEQAEGASPAQFAFERARLERDQHVLATDQRVVEIDLETHRKAVI